MILGNGIGYRYPGADRWAVRGVTLDIRAGEILRLRGRNGTGKSTLLKIIAGLIEPTEGVLQCSPGTRPVYMDQSADKMLAFGFTVGEQLTAFHKMTPDGRSPGFLLKEFGVGIDARLDDFVGHLSGGQRQIVALLATIQCGSNLLCLDEFLSALDARSVEVATALIEKLISTKKISVIAVSHSTLSLSCTREVSLDELVI